MVSNGQWADRDTAVDRRAVTEAGAVGAQAQGGRLLGALRKSRRGGPLAPGLKGGEEWAGRSRQRGERLRGHKA